MPRKIKHILLISALMFFGVAFSSGAAYAQTPDIQSPVPGSQITSPDVTFTWSAGTGVSEYFIGIGTTQASVENSPYGDIFSANTGTQTSVSVTVPMVGLDLYVRLWYRDASGWQFTDHTYTTVFDDTQRPELTSHDGTVDIDDWNVDFTWDAGQNVTEYWLGVSTTQAGLGTAPYGDIFAGSTGLNMNRSVVGVPLNGSPVYVRLWYRIANRWFFTDYTLPTVDLGVEEPEILTPIPGTLVDVLEIDITWSEDPTGTVEEYFLGVADSFNGIKFYPYGNIFAGTVTGGTQHIKNIDVSTDLLHARLWYKLWGKWQYKDIAYMTAEVRDVDLPRISSPPGGTLLQSRYVDFQWGTVTPASEYFLAVAKNFESLNAKPWGDVYASNVGTATSQSVEAPLGGLTYARLWYKVNGIWGSRDYVYPTFLKEVNMIAPAEGDTITTPNVVFSWTEGSDVEEYMIGVGRTQADVQNAPFGDIYPATSVGLNLTHTVTGIPDDANEVHVRLSYRVGTEWSHLYYRYDVLINGAQVCGNDTLEPPEECDDGNLIDGDGCSSECLIEVPINVDIFNPVPGAILPASDVTFEWNAGPTGSVYGLSVGTCNDQPSCTGDIFSQTGITATSVTATGIPMDGSTVYVTLNIDLNAQSVQRDYTYSTPTSSHVPGDIYNPPPGSTISTGTVRFDWWPLDEPVQRYIFYLGSCTVGDCQTDLFGADVGQATTVTVNNFPLDGAQKYATLAFVFDSKPTEYRTFPYFTTTISGCGNGQVDPGEQCDGNVVEACPIDGYIGTRSCQSDCQFSACTTSDFCGDGDVTGPEECDDMNSIDTDSCNNSCMFNGVNPVYNDYDVTDNTIVIYNANYAGGQSLANYYAAARSIPSQQVCAVNLPVGNYATKDQLLGARKNIVENCICDLIPAADRPSPCDITNLDNVAAESPVTHMVLMKGMPARVFNTGWATDDEEPSFDYYLSYLLYRDEDIFGATNGSVSPEEYQGALADTIDNQPDSPIDGMTRSIIPGLDKFVAYGRIEAIDDARTIELIDRTIAAEQAGIQGNLFLAENFLSPNLLGYAPFSYMSRLTSSLDNICINKNEWDQSCRAGFSFNGHIPGEENAAGGPITNIENPIDAGFLVGSDPFADGTNGGNSFAHRAFDGFDNMLNWHVNTALCTELCQDFPTQTERDTCRANSTDIFKEINTDCVGAAPGFMAYQTRSWTVQGYGFFPAGWEHVGNGNGAVELTFPTIEPTGGFTNARFTDTSYISYGSPLAAAGPMCDLETGQEACEEFIGVNLRHTVDFTPDIVNPGTYSFDYRIRFKNFPSPGGQLKVDMYVFGTSDQAFLPTQTISLDSGNNLWTTVQGTFTVNGSFGDIQFIHFDIHSDLANPVRGWIELDGIELIDNQTVTHVIDADTGSFNNPQLNTGFGDWAANVIDRMGGIASWGSSSQHVTGGWAFEETDRKVLPAITSGRSLGEALAMTPLHHSGLIYGDPLYRPSAAKIYLESDRQALLNSPSGAFTFDDTTAVMDLNIVAWHGTANATTTEWTLSYCNGHNVKTCNDTNGWTDFDNGAGAMMSSPVNVDFMTLVADDTVSQDITVRLMVSNPAQPGQALYNHAFFSYTAPAPVSDVDVPAQDIAVIPMSVGTAEIIDPRSVPMSEIAIEDPNGLIPRR